MSPADAWLAGYAAVVATAALTILLRRAPTLLRGSVVFLFTIGYLVVASAVLAWRDADIPARAIGAAVGLVLVTGAMAPWWFVIGGPRTAIGEIIETCFGRVCARYERTSRGFVMTVPGGGLHVGVHPLGTERMTALRFRERPPHKKGELFRRLLIKQWSGPLPTIRIRIR